jgi:hypothetical protein
MYTTPRYLELLAKAQRHRIELIKHATHDQKTHGRRKTAGTEMVLTGRLGSNRMMLGPKRPEITVTTEPSLRERVTNPFIKPKTVIDKAKKSQDAILDLGDDEITNVYWKEFSTALYMNSRPWFSHPRSFRSQVWDFIDRSKSSYDPMPGTSKVEQSRRWKGDHREFAVRHHLALKKVIGHIEDNRRTELYDQAWGWADGGSRELLDYIQNVTTASTQSWGSLTPRRD